MTLQGLMDFLDQYAVWFWLFVSAPGCVIGFIAGFEGNRLVLLSRNEGNTEAPGARLLRFVGFSVAVVLLCFTAIGVLSAIDYGSMSSPQVSLPASMLWRRLVGYVLFLLAPPLLDVMLWRVLRFVAPPKS